MRVLITGCNSGFGLGTAALMSQRGHEVFATVRRPEAATELSKLRDAGHSIHIEKLDVRDAGQCEDVVGRIIKEGGVDALINNAGASVFAPVEATSIEQMRDLMEINVIGPFRLIQLALPHMRARRSGKIINVSSLSGIVPLPYMGLYGATKHALDAMTFSLAAELHEFGIHVSLISPSGFKTSIRENLWEPGVALHEPVYKERTAFVHAKMKSRMDNDPAPVFTLLADTLESPCPPVRQLIGGNAVNIAKSRAQMTDGEWFDSMLGFLET